MKEIAYTCSDCASTFTATADRAGQSSRCWSCGKDIQIPEPTIAPKKTIEQPAPTQPTPEHVKTKAAAPAQGVLRAGWICFGLGMILMLVCFVLPFYSALFFASFILSIIAIGQKRHRAGLSLLFSTIFIPAITAGVIWAFIIGTAANEFEKSLASNPQSITLPQQILTPAKPVSPIQQKMIKTSPAPKPIIRRSAIPSQTVSLESLLSLLEQKAHGFQTADTSLDRDEIIQSIRNRTTEALSDYALQFTATITDVRTKRDGVYQVSFKELNDGGLNKNKSAYLRISPASSITLKMDHGSARNLHSGQKITVRAKASLSTGLFHPSNFVLDIWVKSHSKRIGSVSIQANTFTIQN